MYIWQLQNLREFYWSRTRILNKRLLLLYKKHINHSTNRPSSFFSKSSFYVLVFFFSFSGEHNHRLRPVSPIKYFTWEQYVPLNIKFIVSCPQKGKNYQSQSLLLNGVNPILLANHLIKFFVIFCKIINHTVLCFSD